MTARRWIVAACLVLGTGCSKPSEPLTDDPYLKQLLNTDKPVLVDCWATWCPPCRRMAPVIDQLAAEYQGRAVVAKLDVDKRPETAKRLGISSIPALLFFKDGRLVQRMVGVQPKSKLAATLDKLGAKKS